jgi:TonB family protein
MSEAWKQWEGRIVDGKFPLRQFLGGSEHSAVFLTERGDPAQRVAIKFIQVEPSAAELQLSRWQRTAKLSHPHLLRLYESGRCRIGDFNLLYLVMEYANENLAEFLPQRPLTPAETRDVLAPALQALGFLHREGLVHGHIQPSNILAIDDQLKLSSDTISPATLAKADNTKDAQQPAAGEGEFRELTRAGESATLRRPSAYCAPEALKGATSREADIWSLGMSLVEMLTQRAPAFDYTSRQDPVLPETLSALYLDIARHCLKRDAKQRWTVAQIAERLNVSTAGPARTIEMVPATAQPTAPAVASGPAPSVAPVIPAAPVIAGVGPIAPRVPAATPPAASVDALAIPPAIAVSSAPLPQTATPIVPVASAMSSAPAAATAAKPATVVTASTRVPPPVPSKSEPYHIPAARPPLQSHTIAGGRGDVRHHDTGLPGLPKLKRPPLMPMPKANYFVLGVGIGVVFVTFLGLRLFSHRTPIRPQTVATAAAEPPVQKAAQPPARGKSPQKGAQKASTTAPTQTAPKNPPPAATPTPNAVKATSEKQPAAVTAKASAPSSRTDATSAATVPPNVAAAASSHVVHGEVLNQVLPDVSDKARSTIWGTVRVAVKVHVDPVGNVSGAELDSPGPSRFFADKALQAAKNWDFAPAKLDGHNVASDWVIKFHFTHSDIKAYPTEETP